MADLMLRREGVAAPTGEDRRRYRALRLGRSDGDTLLTELLPYPHPKASDWLYECFGRYMTRSEYEREIMPHRLNLLRRVLAESPRDLVVCYGKSAWGFYKEIFGKVSWMDEGPFCIAEIAGTRVILTTHFSGRAFNTDADLAHLAKVALRSLRSL